MDGRRLSTDLQANRKQHDELTAVHVPESAERWGPRALQTVLYQLVLANDPKIRSATERGWHRFAKRKPATTFGKSETIFIMVSMSLYLFFSRKAGTLWP